jgi:hypothetical protein
MGKMTSSLMARFCHRSNARKGLASLALLPSAISDVANARTKVVESDSRQKKKDIITVVI